MDALKVFAVGVARIAAIIVVVIVSLTILGFGGVTLWQSWTAAQEAARTAPLEEATEWPAKTATSFEDVEVTLSTKWLEGQLLYQFRVNGYPPAIAAGREGRNAFWLLRFMDDDGFQVDQVDVSLNSMSLVNRRLGPLGGLSINTATSMSADQYRRIANWTLGWRGFPDQ